MQSPVPSATTVTPGMFSSSWVSDPSSGSSANNSASSALLRSVLEVAMDQRPEIWTGTQGEVYHASVRCRSLVVTPAAFGALSQAGGDAGKVCLAPSL